MGLIQRCIRWRDKNCAGRSGLPSIFRFPSVDATRREIRPAPAEAVRGSNRQQEPLDLGSEFLRKGSCEREARGGPRETSTPKRSCDQSDTVRERLLATLASFFAAVAWRALAYTVCSTIRCAARQEIGIRVHRAGRAVVGV